MYSRSVFLGFALLVGLVAPARAADQTVLGKSFTVKDLAPGTDPSHRSILVLGKEPGSPNTVVGDPLAGGATVEVIANGAVPTDQVFTLPPGAPVSGFAGWKAIGSPVTGYSYKDPMGENGPVKAVLIEKTKGGTFLVKVTAAGNLGNAPQPHITVVPPAPGTDGGIRLTLDAGDTYCVAFGGGAGGTVKNLPANGLPDHIFKIASTKGAPTTEAGCPTSALTPTTTVTTTSTSSSSTTSSTSTTTSTETSTSETSSTSTETSTTESTSSSTETSSTESTTSSSTSTSTETSTTESSSSTTSTTESTSSTTD